MLHWMSFLGGIHGVMAAGKGHTQIMFLCILLQYCSYSCLQFIVELFYVLDINKVVVF